MHKQILIIDDEQDILDIMTICLENEGFDVKTASYAKDLFPLIDQYHPDLVVLDYVLNDINGGELCKQIKNNPQTNYLPVFLFSAYPGLIESFGTYGCDGFISKPFDIYDMINRFKLFFSTEKNTPLN